MILKGKKVILTGASGRIGFETAKTCLKKWCIFSSGRYKN